MSEAIWIASPNFSGTSMMTAWLPRVAKNKCAELRCITQKYSQNILYKQVEIIKLLLCNFQTFQMNLATQTTEQCCFQLLNTDEQKLAIIVVLNIAFYYIKKMYQSYISECFVSYALCEQSTAWSTDRAETQKTQQPRSPGEWVMTC